MLRVLPLLVVICFTACFVAACANATTIPDPLKDAKLEKTGEETGEKSIVFAGGCFWGVEAVFQHVKGVKDAVSGYAGGDAATAHYDMVSRGNTNHAEAVKITYDPSVITPGQLMKVFFSVAHDPTQLNYQGPDHGTQYRSHIFFTDEQQRDIAQGYIAQLDAAKIFSGPVVTRVDALDKFYAAEEYHQDFARKNPNHRYIVTHDAPKVLALKKNLLDLYVDQENSP